MLSKNTLEWQQTLTNENSENITCTARAMEWKSETVLRGQQTCTIYEGVTDSRDTGVWVQVKDLAFQSHNPACSESYIPPSVL